MLGMWLAFKVWRHNSQSHRTGADTGLAVRTWDGAGFYSQSMSLTYRQAS